MEWIQRSYYVINAVINAVNMLNAWNRGRQSLKYDILGRNDDFGCINHLTDCF